MKKKNLKPKVEIANECRQKKSLNKIRAKIKINKLVNQITSSDPHSPGP